MGGRELRPADAVFGRLVAAFGHQLHEAGIPMTLDRSARMGAAIGLAAPATVEELYWLGRVTLLTARGQVAAYDRVFQQIFLPVSPYAEVRQDEQPVVTRKDVPKASDLAGETGSSAEESVTNQASSASPPGEDEPAGLAPPGIGAPAGEASEEAGPAPSTVLMSSTERLASKDFAACSPGELAMLARVVERLRFVPPPRRTRRLRASRTGRQIDVRATIQRSRRTAGDPLTLVRRERALRPRRVVLIADVSGSMEAYSRLYLHLMRSAVQVLHSEAFVFATRITRLTKVLASHHPDVAYQRALERAPDWSGGTRMGQALADFVNQHGRRGLARGAVVVIVSDGWETGDVTIVEESMRRLCRLAHHIVWINPRKAADGYQPLVGGMAAALPFVDTFVPGHSYRTLEEVVEAIGSAVHRRDASSAQRTASRRAAAGARAGA